METPFRVLQALIQRGKGGVYQAIDFSSDPPRLCLLKEGRKHGEVTWDGRDGAWRVRNEERVLKQLAACGVKVPEVYSSFEVQENYYLAMEFIAGESLHQRAAKAAPAVTLNAVCFPMAYNSLHSSRGCTRPVGPGETASPRT